MTNAARKDPVLMLCGHAANGELPITGTPVCVICLCELVAAAAPDLTGRKAYCTYKCGSTAVSNLKLPFFAHNPAKPSDTYYCGCFGWD